MNPIRLRVVLTLWLAAAAIAQDQSDALLPGSPAPILAGTPAHGLPGRTPGTERWIVDFKERSFDLDAFRAAIYAHRPAAEVASIVADLEQRVHTDQAAFVDAAERLGAHVTAQWWLVNAAAVELPAASVADLRQLPMVAFVQPDVECLPVIITATNANNHDADSLQALGFKGQGATAGIIDTGQDADMAGTGRPHRTYFVNGDPGNTTGGGIGGSRLLVNRQIGLLVADDQNGHGTGVASIAAGANWGTPSADDGHAPLAGIAAYAIANQVSSGSSDLQTMATAWQALAADRAACNIVAANISYAGSPDPLSVDQQALDSAALNADVMCCVAAGNAGPGAGSTAISQGAANGLAVAAIAPDVHTVASFSSRGPLATVPQRFYPDIAGCGVGTIMAARDDEAADFVASGTSMAAPMVTGAATQLRARFPLLTALETKAILLASALNIAAPNPGLDRNAFGMGMLRNDRAHAIAAAGRYGTAVLTSSAAVHTFALPATAGHTYAVAIAWHRQSPASPSWSNLDLEVLDPNGELLLDSSTPHNLYEMVRIQSPVTGNLTVRALARTFAPVAVQPFSWAWTEAPHEPFPASVVSYGYGCLGSGVGMGSCTSINPGGGTLTADTRANEYAYDLTAPAALAVTGFDVFSATTTGGPVTVAAAIYGDAGGVPDTTALATTTVTIGSLAGFYRGTFGAPVAVPAGPFWLGVDHHLQTTLVSQLTAGTAGGAWFRAPGSVAWAPSTLVTTPALRALCASGHGVPALAISGGLQLGQSFGMELAQAPAHVAALLTIGRSDRSFAGGALPFPLTAYGAPGCSLFASADSTLLLLTDALGQAGSQLSIPNSVSYLGARVFVQYAVFDAVANALGLTVSNAARLTFGGS